MTTALAALDGLRVLDLTRFIAGPHCAMVLADLGADVVKVERPTGGDDTRAIGPHVAGESIYFMVFNRNKRSITIDLRDAAGQQVLRDLVREADVLIENFRPGTMERMGCGWPELEALNPRLIMARISGFGQTGGDEPCFDAVAQAGSGLMAITGQPDGPPTMAGTCIVDYSAGLHAAIGILAAIAARHRTGRGQVVDVSLMGSAVSLLMTAIPEHRLCAREMTRAGNQDRYAAPGQTFCAADGAWVHIVGGNDGPFPRLAAAIGRPELPAEARFATIPARVQNRAELDAIVREWVADRSGEAVLAALVDAGVPAARVASVAEVASSQLMWDRGFIVGVPHEVAGVVPMQGMPIRLSATPGAIRRGSPRLGEHTSEIAADWLGPRKAEASGLDTKQGTSPMSATAESTMPWRDLTDPRRAATVQDLEAGLKEPVFENLEIPETLGPVTVVIDDHKIKRFSFTQDDYSPWYLQASPFDGARIGQACLLGNDMVQLFTTRYRASKTVGFHTEEQMWFDNPVKLGERVTMSGTYVEAYVRRGQGYVVMEAKAVGEDGRTIVRHRGVEILRTVPGAIGGRASGMPERRVTGEVPGSARVVETIGDDVRVGDVLAPMEKTITAEQSAVFSRVGEFVRNTHNDLEIARAGELPTIIVQGQQQAGLIGEYLVRAFGAAWFTNGWFQVKFVNVLQVFDPIAISAIVTEIAPAHDGGRKVELEVWARRKSDGKLTTVGWASCLINA